MENEFVREAMKNESLELEQIVTRIVECIDASEEKLECAVKWGQLTYAQYGDFHHWIVGFKVTKMFIGLVFHFGGLLEGSKSVFVIGTSKFSRKITYQRIEDMDQIVILDFLRQALGNSRISKSIGKKFKTVNKHKAMRSSPKNYPGCDWRSDNESTTHS